VTRLNQLGPCEVCGNDALWSIRRSEKEGSPGLRRSVAWVGDAHLRCFQHVTSIDAIEQQEAK
jgi:hypothetical protein